MERVDNVVFSEADLGQFVLFERQNDDCQGFECTGVVLSPHRIGILVYSYTFFADMRERELVFQGILQDLTWRPRIVHGEIVNKEVLFSPCLPEIFAISDLCKEKYGLSPKYNLGDSIKNELSREDVGEE